MLILRDDGESYFCSQFSKSMARREALGPFDISLTHTKLWLEPQQHFLAFHQSTPFEATIHHEIA